MTNFFGGIAWTASLGAAMFFLRFWRDTRDRFFAMFALAFVVLSVNWLPAEWITHAPETRHFFYLARLAAFLLIIAAVVEKNRSDR